MPDDASGNASRPPSPMAVSGQGADAPQLNVPVDDIYACLNRRHFSDGRKPFTGHQNLNGYKATGAANGEDPQDYVTLAQVQSLLASTAQVPTGAIIAFTGSVIPAAWIEANGQSLSRTTYASFWTWVQTSGNLAATQAAKTHGQYGPGDGSTTFTVPNLYADSGYFIRPISSGRGIGTAQADEIKLHNHGGSVGAAGGHRHDAPASLGAPMEGNNNPTGNYAAPGGVTSDVPDHVHAIPPQGGPETRPKNIAYPVIIKT